MYYCRIIAPGGTFFFTQVTFERISGSDVGEMLKRNPVGKVVQVYYNPANPAQAVIERSLLPVVVKGVFLLLFIFLGATILTPQAMTFLSGWLEPLLPRRWCCSPA